MTKTYDCVIIGGGPAGLNGALVLGRARKSVLVIDEGRPRNRVTRQSHGFLTRDGIAPNEFRNIARDQIYAYPSVEFVTDIALSLSGVNGRFQITTVQGVIYRSKKVLFATGKKDLPVEINGLAEVYGKSAFTCPYCDGWELRDQPLVLIYKGARALHMAKLISGWTDQFTICTNGSDELTSEEKAELRQHHVPVFDSPVKAIHAVSGNVQCVELEDGSNISCRGIFFEPKLANGSDLPRSIGCQVSEAGSVITDRMGKTSVPGIYCAGDAAAEMHQLIVAASSGAMAGASIHFELQTEAWDQ